MIDFVCDCCGKSFCRNKTKTGPRFCSQECYHTWNRRDGENAGRFGYGNIPWNKGVKGLHLSPESEFKKGARPTTVLPCGSVRVRKRINRKGAPRAWVKVAEPNVWILRARVIWEKAFGKIPDGAILHHLDGNALNDTLSNLAVVSRAMHINTHRSDLLAAKAEKAF